MSELHAAVIDIGKTNKKLLVYDRAYNILQSEQRHIPERQVGDLLIDDMDGIEEWTADALDSAMRKHRIGVVSVTTHGATVVHLDQPGNRVFPCISYQQPVSESFDREFYNTWGSGLSLYRETAAPPLGVLLNSGRQFVWLRDLFPDDFARVRSSLFMPQYVSYLLCGEQALEITSIGTHSYLWDFKTRGWSSLVNKGGFAPLFASPFKRPWETLGSLQRTGLFEKLPPGDCRVASGIHDSNAALLPYLLGNNQPFVILSTGSWMVGMRPRTPFALDDSDFDNNVLYYLDVYGEPVRATLARGGMEFDYYRDLFQQRCPPDDGSLTAEQAILAVLRSDVYIVPTLYPGSGQFPHSKGRIINEAECLRHPVFALQALNLSMAIQSAVQLDVLQPGDMSDVVLEGGFINNEAYMGLLAALCPHRRVYKRDDAQGTSLGAAVCGFAAQERLTPDRIDLPDIWSQLSPVAPMKVDREVLKKYRERFLSLCRTSAA